VSLWNAAIAGGFFVFDEGARGSGSVNQSDAARLFDRDVTVGGGLRAPLLSRKKMVVDRAGCWHLDCM
jgi:hypothetical protein